MRWGVIILLILGVVAAASAALLVATMRANSSDSGRDSSPGVEVATAKVSMPAMTVLTLDYIVREEIPQEELPEGRIAAPTRVIGRVLAVPVVEGQILTEACFVTAGTGAQLAAALPHGMRAVTVNLARGAIPDGLLLYPGCVVDVLVSFKLGGAGTRADAISSTMLRGVQVLAVSGDSVISNSDGEADSGGRTRRSGRSTQVTLLVDPKQAEALQLAALNGNISLAVRNPLDKNLVDMDGTVLSRGRLGNLGALLKPVVEAEGQQRLPVGQPLSVVSSAGTEDDGTAGMMQDAGQTEAPEVPPPPRWGVTVIRGKDTTVEDLTIPEDEADAE